MVFQNPENQIICQNLQSELSFGLESSSDNSVDLKDELQKIKSLLPFVDDWLRHPSTLSGGEMEILNIITAFTSKSEVVLIDDGLSYLNPNIKKQWVEWIKKNYSKTKTILWFTSDYNDLSFGKTKWILSLSDMQPYDNSNSNPEYQHCHRKGLLSIKTKDLTFGFEASTKTIIHKLNINLSNARSVGIIGENGSGKTTLSQLISNSIKPLSGSVELDISNSNLSVTEMIETAWASASTFRGSDKRGGANGARIRLEPQKNWEVNNPSELSKVLNKLEIIKKNFDSKKKVVSIADLIVLGGCAAIEKAVNKAGHKVNVPFSSGRGDASQDQTDTYSFGLLEPKADGFRNYITKNTNGSSKKPTVSAEEMLVDKAQLMRLSAPEMTVLVGGMRSLGITKDNLGNFSEDNSVLDNEFFKKLLDMNVSWRPNGNNAYEGVDKTSGEVVRTASRVDLVFGSNSQLRSLAEVYASDDANDKFVNDFIAAWNKVMNADRF